MYYALLDIYGGIYHEYTAYIPVILVRTAYNWNISLYVWHIPGIYRLSGFQMPRPGRHWPALTVIRQ
jgi:hypothetical protein